MSVPKSIQRMVIVPRGNGMSSRMKNKKGEISGMFDVRVYAMDFFKLSKIKRPEIFKKKITHSSSKGGVQEKTFFLFLHEYIMLWVGIRITSCLCGHYLVKKKKQHIYLQL